MRVFHLFFGKFSKKGFEKHEFSEINYSFKKLEKFSACCWEKQSEDSRNGSIFFAIRKFLNRFFENFSKNVKLLAKLLCLLKRQLKYQSVETNII
jgi:hypothetical protein